MRHHPQFFINAPYRMAEVSMPRFVSMETGVEIYTDNNVIDEIDMIGAKDLGRKLADNGVPCTVHAPFIDLSPGGFDRAVRAITKEKLKKAVGVAIQVGAKAIICHPGYDRWRFDGNEAFWLEGSRETFGEVLKEAGKGLPVFVENIFEERPDTLFALFDCFRDEELFFCFDTGHFNLFSKVPLEGWMKPLGGLIREMHLHDNHGTRDEHLPVGRGRFPFRELKGFVRGRGDIFYTSEVHEDRYVVESIKAIKEFAA
jgi:sugar phosphate isomerase/epimerase